MNLLSCRSLNDDIKTREGDPLNIIPLSKICFGQGLIYNFKTEIT